MRKLILSMQVSLDGYIEGGNGDMSWLQRDDPEQWKDLFEMLESVDLFLLGRVMYPDYRDYWILAPMNEKASSNEKKYAQMAEKTDHIVFSNTLKESGWDNTRIISSPVAEEVKKIKQVKGRDIQIIGGAKLAATLLNAGLVDEYRLTVNPVILAKGKSFFNQSTLHSRLELLQAKTLKSGVVILKYKTA
jgi:dihydrofolate reductase